jgi:hypothetical protein
VPAAAILVSTLVVRGGFKRVEHVLLLMATVFVTYFASGILAHPHWRAATEGLVVPVLPLQRHALLVVTATVGTTLAPWGLAFIQSYAVDKRLGPSDLALERVDVIAGAVMMLAAAILPLSTAYSVSEALGRKARVEASVREEPIFYGTYALVVGTGALVVLVPGAPLVPILFIAQAINAVLLLSLLGSSRCSLATAR